MRFFNTKFLLVLALLIIALSAQRGGGSRSSSRSSSRSRSSFGRSSYRRRSYSGGSWWPWGAETNTTNSTADGQQGEEVSSGTSYGVIAAILGAFGGLGYLGHQTEKKKKVERMQKLQRMFVKFEGDCEANACTLSPSDKAKARDWFMSNKWQILFKTKNGGFNESASVTLKNIEDKSQLSYRFTMSMIDSIGASEASGVLVHQADYFSIMFQKTYNDRQEAGQTGSYDLLIYEGVQQGECFRGKWYYQGYEQSYEYSGTWQMIHT